MPFDSYETPFISYAQAREDVVLLRSLRDIPVDQGFYIDIGAYHPTEDSLTKAFYDAGWHGINVEPSAELMAPFNAERTRDINLQVAVSASEGELTFYGNGTGQLGTLEQRYAGPDWSRERVRAVTLARICEDYARTPIHFLKIDVEGHERGVLEGMDFSRFRPWIMIIEAVKPNTHVPTYDEWEDIVLAAGYRFVLADAINRYYLAEEHSDLASNFTIVADNFQFYREYDALKEAQQRISHIESELREVRYAYKSAPSVLTETSVKIARVEEPPIYIGLACDHNFVEHTAVTLTSLDMNADLPDATIILAGFDLTDNDRAMLRAAAGTREVRLIDVTPDMVHEVNPASFTAWYPLAVLGRLLVADQVDVPNARMVTMDSDMIVNGSLRPLVYRDLENNYFAAAHDAPRVHDLGYFNSGLTLFDVDMYKHHDVARRCLRWLREQERIPGYPDQDALNHIVGHLWHRLSRTWNYFNYEPSGFTTEDFTLCRIAHFAGPKPWHYPDHPGLPLYRRYAAEMHRRTTLSNLAVAH